MLNDDEFARALRAALPRAETSAPSRDLWPALARRAAQPPQWSLADWSATAIIVVGLLMFPNWFWFLAFHW